MENNDSLFTWGDNWWIEDDRAWFVSGLYNGLFRVNLNTNECESAVCIPEEADSKFRLMPLCIKCGDDIFCMPDIGDNIWVYSICSGTFSKISVRNPDKTRLGMRDFWEYENKLFAVSQGLGQIIALSIKEKKIENYYDLCKESGLGKSIRIGTAIYSLSGAADAVYSFDMFTKEISTYKLPDIGRRLASCCFCFDGEKFWLGGYRKEIYVWDMDDNSVTAIDGFPKEFGVYDFTEETDGEVNCETEEYERPTFLHSAAADGSVWFSPFQANKIIYVDQKTYEVHTLEIPEEDETRESLWGDRSLDSKYILEYVKDGRYLGLFSLKNNCMIEIDAIEKKYQIKNYTLTEECIGGIIGVCHDPVWYEKRRGHKALFKYELLNQKTHMGDDVGAESIGARIYETILGSRSLN